VKQYTSRIAAGCPGSIGCNVKRRTPGRCMGTSGLVDQRSAWAPGCLFTVTTTGVRVATVTVTLAILDTVVGLTAYDAIGPFPVPDGSPCTRSDSMLRSSRHLKSQ